jgi:hypothetical protein
MKKNAALSYAAPIPLSLLQSECVHLCSNLASGVLLRLRTYTDHIHGKEKKEHHSFPPD